MLIDCAGMCIGIAAPCVAVLFMARQNRLEDATLIVVVDGGDKNHCWVRIGFLVHVGKVVGMCDDLDAPCTNNDTEEDLPRFNIICIAASVSIVRASVFCLVDVPRTIGTVRVTLHSIQ